MTQAHMRPDLGLAAELVELEGINVIHVNVNGGRVLSLVESEARDLLASLKAALAILDEARGVHDVPVPFVDPERYREHRRTCGLCRRLGGA